ncbi:tetratricopeptide repeat protein [candidate division TA06 bacterium]|nr:tetratricopeptide repeat protein [candidate division TA06 bacterium]
MIIDENRTGKYEDAFKIAEKLSAMNWVDLAVEVLTRAKGFTGNEEQEASLFSRLGEYHIKKGDYELAVIQLENAMGRLLHRPDSLELFYVYRNIAWTFWRQGYLERADSYTEGAKAVIEKREQQHDNDTNKARACLFHLQALLAGARGDNKTAIEHYKKETEILELYNFTDKLGAVYGNLCGIYRTLGNYAQAIDYQLKSIEIAEKQEDLLTVGIGCNNLGEIYQNLGNFQKAELYFNRYLEINSRIDNSLGDSFALAGMARLHVEWKDYTRAEALYRRALVKAMSVKSKVREAGIMANMALLYGIVGKVDQALKQVDQAIAIYEQTGRLSSQWHQIIRAKVWYQMAEQEPDRRDDAFYLLEQTVSQPIITDDEQDLSSQEIALEAYTLLARIGFDKNDASLAEEYLKKARFFIDQLMQNIPAELQAGFLSKALIKNVNELEDKVKELLHHDTATAGSNQATL